MPPARVLAAADSLFASTAAPITVTMDAIATAANVGKGTLFRAFGSRDALLDALWTTKLAALRDAVDGRTAPLGQDALPVARAVAFLDALLGVKLSNRHLLRAREMAAGLHRSEHYQWMHGLLRRMIADAGSGEPRAGYTAHALLAGLHIDLVDEMLSGGMALDTLRRAQADHVRAAIADAARA